MNLFTISPDQRQYVLDESVFFISKIDDANIPELLYRSNYKGLVQFMDEPVYLATAHKDLTEAKTPVEAADKVVSQIRERFLADGSYQLRQGNLFDLVYWGDGEITGYKKVRMIMENATVEE